MKIKIGAFCAVLFILFGTVQAQQQFPLIANVDGRRTTTLLGRWQIIIDPYETGYYDYRYQPRKDGYFNNTKPKSPSDLVEYDFDSSQQLDVPATGIRRTRDYSSTRALFGIKNPSTIRRRITLACSSISGRQTTWRMST